MKLRVDWEKTTKYISYLLNETFYSIAAFSRYLGYESRTLQDRLAKHNALSYDILLNLADYLGYRVDELVILEGQDFDFDSLDKSTLTMREKRAEVVGINIEEKSAKFYKYYLECPIRNFEELFLFLPLFSVGSCNLHYAYDAFFLGDETTRQNSRYRLSQYKYLFNTLEKGKALEYAVAFRDVFLRHEFRDFEKNLTIINDFSYSSAYSEAQKQLPEIFKNGKELREISNKIFR